MLSIFLIIRSPQTMPVVSMWVATFLSGSGWNELKISPRRPESLKRVCMFNKAAYAFYPFFGRPFSLTFIFPLDFQVYRAASRPSSKGRGGIPLRTFIRILLLNTCNNDHYSYSVSIIEAVRCPSIYIVIYGVHYGITNCHREKTSTGICSLDSERILSCPRFLRSNMYGKSVNEARHKTSLFKCPA